MFFAILAQQLCDRPGGDRHEIKLIVKGGELAGLDLDGQPIPLERLRIAGDRLQLLGEDGEAICTIGQAH